VKNKACRGPYTLPVKAPSGPFIGESNFVCFIMHYKRGNDYKMSYRNLVAADPAEAHTMETLAAHIKRSQCMQHSPLESWVLRSWNQDQPMEEEHQHLATNSQALLEYMDQQAQAIAHFKDMERLLGDNCIHACTCRWNTLSHSLKIREYHTPTRMREALA